MLRTMNAILIFGCCAAGMAYLEVPSSSDPMEGDEDHVIYWSQPYENGEVQYPLPRHYYRGEQ